MKKVFLDANVYFSGCVSEQGASCLILELARRERIKLAASRLVLLEAERNLRHKSSKAVLKNFHRFLHQTKIQIIPTPKEELQSLYEPLIHPKDLPVLVAAIESKADFLITLDRRHFLTSKILFKIKWIHIMTPGDFLKEIYLKGKA